jgi:ribulose 1,5-bisphosphate carboxylase large subunit-like protein
MENPSEEAPARWESLSSWLLTQTAIHAHRPVADAFSSVRARGYHYRLLATMEEFGAASQAALGRRSGSASCQLADDKTHGYTKFTADILPHDHHRRVPWA